MPYIKQEMGKNSTFKTPTIVTVLADQDLCLFWTLVDTLSDFVNLCFFVDFFVYDACDCPFPVCLCLCKVTFS